MNGHIARSAMMNGRNSHHTQRDTNSLPNGGQQVVGRYTVLSKSVSRRNGQSTKVDGYYPTTTSSNTDAVHRVHAQQQQHRATSDRPINGVSREPCMTNGHTHRPSVGICDVSEVYAPPSATTERARHVKSHSVTSSSTYFVRDVNSRSQLTSGATQDSGIFHIRDPGNNRSAGGSLSCGQPSPASTTEESLASSVLSPNSLRVDTVQGQSHKQPQQQAHQHYWLHQSELTLPTERDFSDLQGLHASHKIRSTTLEPELKTRSTGNFSTLDSTVDTYYPIRNTSTMYNSTGQTSRTGTDDYFNSFTSAGPSHRKIQTLHGSGSGQRRFPSDNTLNFTPRDASQVYTSGTKPGPVTIPARSRSAQPSPGQSPLASPNTFYRASESNLSQDYSVTLDKRAPRSRTQQIDLQYGGGNASYRGTSSPPQLEQRHKLNSFPAKGVEDDIESPILPSVREIIRQVEAMTQSNAATSTTDISALGQPSGTISSGIPRLQRQSIGNPPQRRAMMNGEHSTRGGILRQGGSSQRTPSAPQLRSTQYTPMQAKFNSIAAAAAAATAQQRQVAPPVPPHGSQTRTSKAIIGSFTRRSEAGENDGSQSQRFDIMQNPNVNKKTEQLSHLPLDYQKLREAFIEQRREIQRLRKQLAEKDLHISQLQSDIRLYEPWR